ncbi:MAG: ATP-binding protein, partial [Solirubrobacteraceae bacterium]
EHGGEHDRERVVTLEAFDDGDSLTTCVSDPGRWSEGLAGEERGRGLRLIRGLSDEALAESTPSGTRVTARHRSGHRATAAR